MGGAVPCPAARGQNVGAAGARGPGRPRQTPGPSVSESRPPAGDVGAVSHDPPVCGTSVTVACTRGSGCGEGAGGGPPSARGVPGHSRCGQDGGIIPAAPRSCVSPRGLPGASRAPWRLQQGGSGLFSSASQPAMEWPL